MRKMARIRLLVAIFLISCIAMIQPLYTEAADSVVVTEYRVRVRDASDYEYQSTTIKGSLGSDWEYIDYDTTTTYGEWGAWSGWSRTTYTKSETMDVESRTIPATYKTQYHYSRYIGQSSSSGYWYTYPWATGICQSYDETAWLDSALPEEWDGEFYGYGRGYDTYGNFQYRGNGQRWDIWWYNPETRQAIATNAYTEYRYRTRTKTVTTTYNYRRAVWGDWSDWKEESEWDPDDIVSSSTRQVQSREKEKGIYISSSLFPDAVFRSYVKTNFDKDGDGYLTQQEINSVTSIDVEEKGITSVSGIELFTELTELNVANNELDELNLSANTLLTRIYCQQNHLTYLDLSRNTVLKTLYCHENELIGMDLGSVLIDDFVCHDNQLSELDVTRFLGLKGLDCTNNPIKKLDVSKNPKLLILKVSDTLITEIDVSNQPDLWRFFCANTQLKTLDVGNNSKLWQIDCSNTDIHTLDLRNTDIMPDNGCKADEDTFVVRTDDDLGWVTREDESYYLVDDGTTPKNFHIATGWTEVDDTEYLFTSEGVFVPEAVRLKDVKIRQDNLTERVWDSCALEVVTDPVTIDKKDLIWESSDPEVVSVDENGVIDVLKEGTAVITVSSVYEGGDSYSIIVMAKPVLTLSSTKVRLNPDSEDMKDFTVDVDYNEDSIQDFEWSVEDESVAEVDQNGKIIAKGVGQTFVNLKATGTNGKTKNYYIKLVVARKSYYLGIEKIELLEGSAPKPDDLEACQEMEEMESPEDLEAVQGQTVKLCARVTDTNGKVYYLGADGSLDMDVPDENSEEEDGTSSLTLEWWTSSTNGNASVNNGFVKTVEPTDDVFVFVQVKGSNIQDVVSLKILKQHVPVREVAIEPIKDMIVGSTAWIDKIKYYPTNADDKADIKWISLDEDVATVNKNRMITAKKAGTAVIQAISADGDLLGEVTVTVKNNPVTDIFLEIGTVELNDGEYRFVGSKMIDVEESEIVLMNGIDKDIYIRSWVNEEATVQWLRTLNTGDDELVVKDVTEEVDGGSDQCEILHVIPNGTGSKLIDYAATDGSNLSRTITIICKVPDGWIQDTATGGMMHYTAGELDTDWQTISEKRYYFGTNGIMRTGWKDISGKRYYFGTDGVMRTGWKDISGKRYYFGTDGVRRTGWKDINGKRYYFGTDGARRTGWQQVSGKWYNFGTDGVRKTGWKQISGKWYYFGTDGAMRTGWQKVGKWYYFGTDGVMRTSWQKIGKWYYFGTDGAMRSGWQKIGKTWYFFKSGEMLTGWLKSGGKWYYFGSDGGMVTGSRKIGKTVYNFGSDGAWDGK